MRKLADGEVVECEGHGQRGETVPATGWCDDGLPWCDECQPPAQMSFFDMATLTPTAA